MKKLGRLFLNAGLATTLFLGYSMVKAQDQAAMTGPGGDKSAMSDQAGDKPGMDGDHKDMGKARLEHMKKELGLSDSQMTKLKTVFKKEMEANKPLRDQEKIDIDTLKQKVDSKASDSDIKDALDKLSSDRDSMEAARKSSMEKMRTILTPTQQAKWVLSMGRGMGDHKWNGKKGEWKKDKKNGGDDAKSAPDETGAAASK